MIKTTTIHLLLIFFSFTATAQWTKLTPTYPSALRVSDITVNDTNIFAVGYRFGDFQGHIFRSFNNGTTWDTLQISPAGYLFETVAFKDKDTAIIGGYGSYTVLLHTVDGGHNWGYYLVDTVTAGINDIKFIDDKRGFAAGYNTAQFYSGNCYYTKDGGNSWGQETTATHTCLDSLGLDYIDFLDVQTGYAVSNFVPHKYLLKTTDTGKHWNIIYTQDGIGGVYFWNVLNGVMVADGGKIFKTSDGGNNWVPKPSPVTDPLLSVSFMNNTIGFAVGANGMIIKTTDGGETWTKETSPTTQPLLRVKCFNAQAYAVGDGGTIIRSRPYLGISELPLSLKLNVYPNPASSVLYVSSTTNQHVKKLEVTLLGMNGRTVRAEKSNQALIQMDINDLPAGIYTVSVIADGQAYTQKISILH